MMLFEESLITFLKKLISFHPFRRAMKERTRSEMAAAATAGVEFVAVYAKVESRE